MKRILSAVAATALLMMLMMSPVSAEPYTETELEGFMQAVYYERVWAQLYDSFEVFFLDVDFDGRQEIITVESGEARAPKAASVFAFMDAELSGRGELMVGELFVCRDTKTGELLIVNRMVDDGKEVCQRMVYDPEEMLLSLKNMSKKQEARLFDYGWHPVVVTKEQTDTVKVYADLRAIFFPAYNGVTYDNGQPPVVDPTKSDSVSTYLGNDPVYISPMAIVGIIAAAVLLTAGVVICARIYRKKGKKGQ